MKYLLLASCTLLLSACGGDNDSPSSQLPDIATPPSQFENNIISVDEGFTQGQSVELILLRPDQAIDNPNWTQTSGPSVELLTYNSKVISFTIPTAADYSFQLSYQLAGEVVEETVNFTAQPADNKLVARLGHSVVEGNGVSLRAFTDTDIDIDTIRWTKTSGPRVVIDENNEDPQLLIFDAPFVAADTIVAFEVNAQDSNGQQYTDNVAILVENAKDIASDAAFGDTNGIANVYPYKTNSPYKDVLTECVYSSQLIFSCLLGDLPILAKDSNAQTPTISQIMDRVVVSHDWMGERFEQYLQAYDQHDDFKNLFRATTAIVLSYDIRPSFYHSGIGAIYLDPDNLWLTPEERDTINEAPDYRSNFASELQFVMPWRYVKDNDYVFYSVPVNERYARPLKDIEYDFANLLYHELGHANDFFPPAKWNTYPANYSFQQATNENTRISANLTDTYPLQSEEMEDLAAARFLGEDVTSTQANYSPDDVAGFYKSDVANDFYNYTSEREDLSMLFEELMMSVRYGVLRDTAVTTDGGGYIVSWGQRGRVGDPSIKERALYVTQYLLPEFDLQLSDNLPAPINMTPGLDWWENLPISPQPFRINAYINDSESVSRRTVNSINFKTADHLLHSQLQLKVAQ